MSDNPNLNIDRQDKKVMALLHPGLLEIEESDKEVEEVEAVVEVAEVETKEPDELAQIRQELESLKAQRTGILNDLASERRRRREAEEKIKSVPQPEAEQEPDKDLAPVDYLEHRYKKEISTLSEELKTLRDTLIQKEVLEEANRVREEEKKFVEANPDYWERLTYFREQGFGLLRQQGLNEEEAVAQLQDAERQVIQLARAQGRKPMELIVEATTNLGFKPKSTAVEQPKTTTTATVEQVKKATQKNTTLSKTSGAGGSDRLTKEDFANLGHADQLAIMSDPDLARQLEVEGSIPRTSIPRRPSWAVAV